MTAWLRDLQDEVFRFALPFTFELRAPPTERNQLTGLPELSVDDVTGMGGGPAFLVRREAPKPIPQSFCVPPLRVPQLREKCWKRLEKRW